MAAINNNSAVLPTDTAANSNTTAFSPCKPQKIVLKRVLQINDNLKLHLYGTQLIVEAGLMLNIPQITIAKAQIIYHRFFYKKNMDLIDYPPFHIAMTCTYLASKLDENPRRHRDILTVFDRLYKKRNHSNKTHLRTIDPHGKRYSIWKENLFNFEIRVLASMGFNCHVDSSHKYLLQLLIELSPTESLAKQSWTLLNDVHRLPNILDYTCLQVSCACIFLSARRLKIKLPDDPSWNELFGVTRQTLHEIASIILELLELPKHAFKLPSFLKEDDDTLDVNPRTVKHQMKVIQKRTLEKHKALKKAKLLKKKKSEMMASKSSTNGGKEVVLKKQVTVPKPVLGLKNGQNGIKKINLNRIGTLTPPNMSGNAVNSKTIHFSSNKDQFEANHANEDGSKEDKDSDRIESEKDDVSMQDIKEKTKDRDRERHRNRKSYKSRDRDRRRDRERRRDRDRRRDRRRKHKSRRDRDDDSSTDSEYHSSRYRRSRRKRRRSRGRDRRDRDRSESYSMSSRSKSRSLSKSMSRSQSRSHQSDGNE